MNILIISFKHTLRSLFSGVRVGKFCPLVYYLKNGKKDYQFTMVSASIIC